jgi:hypothetical protein
MGRIAQSGSQAKSVAARPAKRLRSTAPLSPRLIAKGYGLDDGRKRPPELTVPRPRRFLPKPLNSHILSTLVNTVTEVCPLRC